MLKGVDVSSWQKEGSVNYSQYDFVIIKASEGVNFKDPGLDRHLKGVFGTSDPTPQPNKCYGFYHYARPDLGNTPEAEAQSFLNYINLQIKNCIMGLDWEQKSLNYSPDWALKWLEYVYKKTGVKPLLYIQANQAVLSKYSKIANAGYGLWVAHWGTDYPSFDNWPFYAIWQYRGSPLDLDYFNGDKNTWLKYCGKDEQGMTENEIRKIVREEINSLNEEKAKESVSSWATDAVEWAMNNGVMVGDKEGHISQFRPKSNITREESAQALYNCFKKFDN